MEMLKQIVREFTKDECPRLAAALSYYTVFALPPMLIVVFVVAGAFVDPSALQGRVVEQARSLIGPQAANQVGTIIAEARRPEADNPARMALGLAALLFGATAAFAQLQAALNRVWEVAPDPERGGVRRFLAKRLLSFTMVLGVAFLLLVSLVLSATLAAFGDMLGGMLPGGVSGLTLSALDVLLSLTVFALVFGAIFKVLPDVTMRWQAVALGAVVTSGAFVLGKFVIGFYLGRSDPGSAFGAAGSLAVVLVWIYLSSMILLLGAEFTQVWARRHGEGIRPEPGAVRVIIETRRETGEAL
jgi:membrane protein